VTKGATEVLTLLLRFFVANQVCHGDGIPFARKQYCPVVTTSILLVAIIATSGMMTANALCSVFRKITGCARRVKI
jgi:hypothetical protein